MRASADLSGLVKAFSKAVRVDQCKRRMRKVSAEIVFDVIYINLASTAAGKPHNNSLAQ